MNLPVAQYPYRYRTKPEMSAKKPVGIPYPNEPTNSMYLRAAKRRMGGYNRR